MRWHLRLVLLCTIAAFAAAGCSDSDKPTNITDPSLSQILCSGSISDRVWYDTNCNGLQDAGEAGAPGVTVKLFLCADDSQVGERVTDANGNYSFGGFLPNNYYVTFTAPAGYEFSPNLVGDSRLLDSDPDASGKVACFALECDKNIRSVDAGLCEGETCTSSVGDRVWFDVNCNGIQDKDEPNASGVTVNLYDCEGGLIETTETGANGGYLFDGLAAGSYKICVETPEGYEITLKDQGANDGLDSDGNTDGCTDCFELGECEDRTDKDFGLCEKEVCDSSVGDRVWFDVNCNGIQDKDEPNAPAGLTLTLYTCEGAKVDETTTGANGGYLFDGLDAGSYKICLTVPEGYEITLKDQGANDGLDSDALTGGCTDCFELGECEDRTDKDFGLCEKDGGGEGCTPGFWRNHHSHWAPTGYTPDMIFNDVFGCDLVPDGVTLGQVVDAPQTYGVLAFHAVAALLNSTHPDVDYDWTEAEVIAAACAGDKDSLADSNEDGCTLSGGANAGGGGKK